MFTWMNSLQSFFHSVLAFVLILLPLVIFHEFGHYFFAKLFGVRAQVFSVGFGKALWSRVYGETEWRLSMIPLGGYVKLLGEDPTVEVSIEDQKRALHQQAPWKRFLIFFGGPLFNFILAVFIFMVVLVLGEPQLSNVVGRVVHESVAERSGFQSGDQIISIDGQKIKGFDEVLLILNGNPGKRLDFEVVHPHQTSSTPVSEHLFVTLSSQAGMGPYGELIAVGELEGLHVNPRGTQIGVSDPSSLAGRSGLKTKDRILAVNDHLVTTWEEVERYYEEMPEQTQGQLRYVRASDGKEANWVLEKPQGSKGLGFDFGLFSSELFIEKIIADSPAQKAGLQIGDRLLGVGDQNVQSFFTLKDAVQHAGEKEGIVRLRWERNGKLFAAQVTPTATQGRDPVLNRTTSYTVGVVPMLVLAEPVTYIERIYNPFKLVYRATERVVVFSWRNLVSLKKLATGEVSSGSLGGPIMIGKIAGESLSRGVVAFLIHMAIFSVGLGILNVLPIPVLDGGHLMLLSIEVVRGKPLTLRQTEIVQGIGLLLILTLMGIAFRNDITRLVY